MSGELMSQPYRRHRRQRPRQWHGQNFNLSQNFQTIKDKAFIFHMCIPYDKTSHMIPKYFTL